LALRPDALLLHGAIDGFTVAGVGEPKWIAHGEAFTGHPARTALRMSVAGLGLALALARVADGVDLATLATGPAVARVDGGLDAAPVAEFLPVLAFLTLLLARSIILSQRRKHAAN
jgi:hypothetical protein